MQPCSSLASDDDAMAFLDAATIEVQDLPDLPTHFATEEVEEAQITIT